MKQIERIAQRELRQEVDVIAQAVRLYDEGAQTADAPSFLLAIAGLGSSGQSDVSERDEENLALELGRTQGGSASGDNG